MGTLDFLYGIVLLSMIPVRYEPTERSEMVTQLLFGDTFIVTEKDGGWLHIRNDYDGYEGWISKNTAHQLTKEDYDEIIANKSAVVASLSATATEEGKAPIFIVQGSTLPNYNAKQKTFKVGNSRFQFEGKVVTDTANRRENMVSYAKTYLNTPYLWGGKSPYGIDCSGFVQQVGKLAGISLPRDASQQVSEGEEISFLGNTVPGDLAFFDNEEGRIIHVGLLLGNGEIIHASGQVRIDSIDQEGIYNLDLKRYTHHLRTIKRNISNEGTKK